MAATDVDRSKMYFNHCMLITVAKILNFVKVFKRKIEKFGQYEISTKNNYLTVFFDFGFPSKLKIIKKSNGIKF